MLFLVFEIAGHRFALDTADVVEVLPLVESRPLPGAQPAVIGVFNYHGTLVPLVDIGLLAFGARSVMRRESRIALVDYESNTAGMRRLGILLENATSLLRRDPDDFVDAPVALDMPYAGAVATDQQGMIQRLMLRSMVDDAIWEVVDLEGGARQ